MTPAGPTAQQKRLRRRVAVFVCLSLLLIIIDQLSKMAAVRALGAGQRYTLVPRLLSLELVRNPGATLGVGADRTWLISLAALIACAVLIWLGWRTASLRWTLALAFALAGAAGNLIDRIVHADGFLNGKVTDFLDYGWSVGNLADVFLAVAAVFIIVLVLMGVPFTGADRAASADRSASVDETTGADRAAKPQADDPSALTSERADKEPVLPEGGR